MIDRGTKPDIRLSKLKGLAVPSVQRTAHDRIGREGALNSRFLCSSTPHTRSTTVRPGSRPRLDARGMDEMVIIVRHLRIAKLATPTDNFLMFITMPLQITRVLGRKSERGLVIVLYSIIDRFAGLDGSRQLQSEALR
jgi:hypothetical protein